MRYTKHFFGLLVVCIGIMFTMNSCEQDNLEEYNPILTATNEKDLGDALVQVAWNNPSAFPILDKNEYSEAYDYMASIMRMVEVKTEIRDKYDWEVLILEDDESLNAFTLPGGKIFITTGFMKFLNAEHQLFALVAHEAFYADRIDRTGQSELSLMMQKLKEDDKYGALGTRVFIDVIGGNTAEGEAMIQFARTAKFEPYEVLNADDFSLDLICNNFLYSAKGIKEMIIKVESNESITEFAWFDNKPPVPTTLVNGTNSVTGPFREQRVQQIDDALSTCGSDNITQNTANYLHIVSNLP